MSYYGVVVLFVLAMAANGTAYVTPNSDFERGVLKLIDKCKSGDVGSLPVPFPSLTPLIMPPRTTSDGRYTMYVGEKKVYGLSNLSVDRLSTSPLSMSIEFSVPLLQVRADYYHVQSEPIFIFRLIDDEGSFACDVYNVKVRADVQFGASGGSTVITSLDLYYSIENLQVYLSGSYELVTDGVRNKLWDRIHSSDTQQKLQNAIKDRARQYLQGHTPEEFMKIIASI